MKLRPLSLIYNYYGRLEKLVSYEGYEDILQSEFNIMVVMRTYLTTMQQVKPVLFQMVRFYSLLHTL